MRIWIQERVCGEREWIYELFTNKDEYSLERFNIDSVMLPHYTY